MKKHCDISASYKPLVSPLAIRKGSKGLARGSEPLPSRETGVSSGEKAINPEGNPFAYAKNDKAFDRPKFSRSSNAKANAKQSSS